MIYYYRFCLVRAQLGFCSNERTRTGRTVSSIGKGRLNSSPEKDLIVVRLALLVKKMGSFRKIYLHLFEPFFLNLYVFFTKSLYDDRDDSVTVAICLMVDSIRSHVRRIE